MTDGGAGEGAPNVSRRWVIVAAITALVTILVIVSAQRTPPRGVTSPAGPRATTTVATTTSTAAGAGLSAPPVVSISGTVDAFDRPDNPSSLAGGPFAWKAGAGTWGINADQALVTTPAGTRSLAVVAQPSPTIAVGARLARVASGSGLVFRYQDSMNYWMVVAVPSFATWAIVRVSGGGEHAVASTGLSRVADGTTIAVRVRRDTFEVVVGGQVQARITDDSLATATAVGLTAAGPDAAVARFEDFRVGAWSGD